MKNALKEGKYLQGLRDGWLSPKRAVDILASSGLSAEGKKLREPSVQPLKYSATPRLLDLQEDITRLSEDPHQSSEVREKLNEAVREIFRVLDAQKAKEKRRLEEQEKRMRELLKAPRQKQQELWDELAAELGDDVVDRLYHQVQFEDDIQRKWKDFQKHPVNQRYVVLARQAGDPFSPDSYEAQQKLVNLVGAEEAKKLIQHVRENDTYERYRRKYPDLF